MDYKRKAESPCENDLKIFKEYHSPSTNSSFESCESNGSDIESELDISIMSRTKTITVRAISRDGEPFIGGLSRPQGLIVWTDGFKQQLNCLYGISLVESKDRPFMFDFRLNAEVSTDKIPRTIEVDIGNNRYIFEYVPEVEQATVGEIATISIKRTRFKISPEQVNDWMLIYGEVTQFPDFKLAPDCVNVRTDEIICKVKIAKHIPSLLPAYGQRLSVTYPGQPITCGNCFQAGHLRAKCTNSQADWVKNYVKSFYEANVSSKLLGRWFDLLKALE